MASIKRLKLYGSKRDSSGDEIKPKLTETGATLKDVSQDDARDNQAYIVDADITLELTLSSQTDNLLKEGMVKYFEWDDKEYKVYRFIKRNDFIADLYGEFQDGRAEIDS